MDAHDFEKAADAPPAPNLLRQTTQPPPLPHRRPPSPLAQDHKSAKLEYWFNDEYLPAQRGICYAWLGRADAAIAAFDEALANLPGDYVRDRAWFLFYSAKAYAHNDEPERAATVARDAVQALIDAGSDGVLDEACKLHARLAGAKSTPEVREFGELLRTAGDQART